jgi:predicted nicotinamide N-methyase
LSAKHLNLNIDLKSELRRKILQKYQVADQKINTPAGGLKMMVVEEPAQLLENFKTDQISTFPYWATIWSSSLGLAYHLATYDNISGASVLDLGCGMGLAGILLNTTL